MWKSGMLIKPTLLMLKKSILDLMAYDVAEGIFYGQVLEFGGKTIVRYMENGSLCDFIGTYPEYLHRSQTATETFQLRVYIEPDVAAR